MRAHLFLAALGCTGAANASLANDFPGPAVDTTVYISNTSTSGPGIALIAKSTRDPNGQGVYGWVSGSNAVALRATSTHAGGYGVYSAAAGGHAVVGTTTGSNPAIKGDATGSAGVGVLGQATHAGGFWGVRGIGTQIGVYGSSAVGEGLRGASTDSVGLHAVSTNGSAVRAVSTNASGVSATGSQYGVEASASHANGVAVKARGPSYGSGVEGTGQIGVRGEGEIGVLGLGTNTGVSGQSFTTAGKALVGVAIANEGKAVWAQAAGTDAVGVYSYATGTNSLAGYFEGNVMVIGDCDPCSPSDIKFKKDIAALSGSLGKIRALRPKSYFMKTEEYKDRIRLPEGRQFGLIAQEVEGVLPELVHPVSVPAHLSEADARNKVRKDPVEFKSVDYKELIPILIGAIQELEAKVAALEAAR